MDLTCPKCNAQLRQYERSGVTIDQCTECRGIFLDRGELEKLVDAEANWQKQQTAPPAPPAPQPQYAQQQYREPHGQQQQHQTDQYGRPYKKKKSFLGELFD